MSKWTADFTNDPFNEYEIIIEILCNDEDVAIVRQGEHGLELKWYASHEDLTVPVEWIVGLLIEAEKRLKTK